MLSVAVVVVRDLCAVVVVDVDLEMMVDVESTTFVVVADEG